MNHGDLYILCVSQKWHYSTPVAVCVNPVHSFVLPSPRQWREGRDTLSQDSDEQVQPELRLALS